MKLGALHKINFARENVVHTLLEIKFKDKAIFLQERQDFTKLATP